MFWDQLEVLKQLHMLQFWGQGSQLHVSAIFNVISIVCLSCRGEISHVFQLQLFTANEETIACWNNKVQQQTANESELFIPPEGLALHPTRVQSQTFWRNKQRKKKPKEFWVICSDPSRLKCNIVGLC